MNNVELKTCPICGEDFEPTGCNQTYCSRKCFKAQYNATVKESDFPYYICAECGQKCKLNFFPKKNILGWKDFECPNCGFKRDKNTELS